MNFHSGKLKNALHPKRALSRSPQALVIILTEFFGDVRFKALLPHEIYTNNLCPKVHFPLNQDS